MTGNNNDMGFAQKVGMRLKGFSKHRLFALAGRRNQDHRPRELSGKRLGCSHLREVRTDIEFHAPRYLHVEGAEALESFLILVALRKHGSRALASTTGI